MNPQTARAIRVYLTALAPLILIDLTNWSATVAVPLVGVLVGALNVAYRRVNPFEGTSQAWRFARYFLWSAGPASIAMAGDWLNGFNVPALAVVPALLEVLFRSATVGINEETPNS